MIDLIAADNIATRHPYPVTYQNELIDNYNDT